VFHLGQLVSQLQARDDGRFDVATDAGMRFIARFVFIAAGVGAFVPRRLMLDEARHFEGGALVYRAGDLDANAGRDMVVLGDGQDAIDTVVALASRDDGSRPASIALLHRRDSFKADAASLARMRALCAEGRIALLIGQSVGFDAAAGDAAKLAALRWIDAEGALLSHRCDRVIALLGVSPKLGPIADWGLALERKQVPVNTESFETQVPGLYAVGDINHYAGKRKLIVSGFHEATLAAFAAAQRLRPDERIATLYTTTSEKLHRLLGVDPGPAAS
jgi:thioredoxin reductase (NADPH)